ncbi:MAG: YtxH domain-containing protein [Bacteroidota bacterium]
MSRKSNSLLTFLLGAAAGATLGILFSPDKGANIRGKLSYKLDKYKDVLEELLEDLVNSAESPISEAKTKSEKVISDAKEKAEKLLEDVDNLIGHIKNEEDVEE